jgi:2-keto-myo-inositol isomerase
MNRKAPTDCGSAKGPGGVPDAAETQWGFHTNTTMTTGVLEDVALAGAVGLAVLEVPYIKLQHLDESEWVRLREALPQYGVEIPIVDLVGPYLRCDGRTSMEMSRRVSRICQRVSRLGTRTLLLTAQSPVTKCRNEHLSMLAGNLSVLADVAGQAGLAVGVEFLKSARLINNLFSAKLLCRQAGRDNISVVVDTYHFWYGPNMACDLGELEPGDVRVVHLSDAPRRCPELVRDEDRLLPGEGIVPNEVILQLLYKALPVSYVVAEAPSKRFWRTDPAEIYRTVSTRIRDVRERLGKCNE